MSVECLKLAEVSNCDFVGIDFFGRKMRELVCKKRDKKYIKIKPRLFKRL